MITMCKLNEFPGATLLEGGSRGVLLMHAYTGTPNDVRSLGRYLNKAGYTVLMPLFDGHGTENPEDILAEGPEVWLESMTAYLQAFKKADIHEVAVFGLSLGGIFAMRSLELFPEQVIGGGSFCSPISDKFQTNIVPSFNFYSKSTMQKANVSAEAISDRLSQIKSALEKQIQEVAAFSKVTFDELEKVNQPTLLVQSGKDKMIEPDDVYDVADELINSRPVIKWYPESGHVVTIGPEKKEFEKDVLLYLNKLKWHTSLD